MGGRGGSTNVANLYHGSACFALLQDNMNENEAASAIQVPTDSQGGICQHNP